MSVTAKMNANSDLSDYPLYQSLSDLIFHQNSQVACKKTQISRPSSKGSDLVGPTWGLIICISLKFTGDDTSGPRPHFEECWPTSCFWLKCKSWHQDQPNTYFKGFTYAFMKFKMYQHNIYQDLYRCYFWNFRQF